MTTESPAATPATTVIDGHEYPVVMSVAAAWAAIEAAGLKTEITDGKRRAYDPRATGGIGWVYLRWVHSSRRGGAYPEVRYGGPGKVSGSFASRCRDALERELERVAPLR